MRLKKLKISGFKSFADAVTFDFDQDLTAIVGPNGCGKSNIVDAFRWVMGEQSAKSMRGDKMQDVLFAGSEKRKPLNFAEVSVTLTNEAKEIALPYDEITLTRKLYRDGESEYLINREPVRLKDIHQLFSGSGIGKNAFSVFEQGKLDQIIHLSPLERRVIFDEAAGIARFLHQKKESVKKLEQVAEHHARMKDIHSEVDKQTKALKKQAHAAKIYQENAKRLEFLEISSLCIRWQKSESLEQGNTLQLEELNKEIEKAKTELQVLEERLQLIKEKNSEREEKLQATQEAVYHSQSQIKIKKAEFDRLTLQADEIEKRGLFLEKDSAQALLQRRFFSEEIKKKSEVFEGISKERDILEKKMQEASQDILNREQALRQLQKEIAEQQKSKLTALHEEHKLISAIKEKSIRLENSLENQKKRELEFAIKEKTLKTLGEESLVKKQAVEALVKSIDQSKQEEREAVDANGVISKELASLQQERGELLREITGKEARLQSLRQLKEEAEGFSVGAKALLKEAQKKQSPLYGKIRPLYELFLHEKNDKNINVLALRPYSYTLVVENEEDLQLLVETAEKKGWKDFSVFCLSFLSQEKKSLEKLLKDHFLEGLTYAPSWQNILQVKKKNVFLSEDGFLLDPRRVLFSFSSIAMEQNFFVREAELKELSEQLPLLKQKDEALIEKITALSKKKKELEIFCNERDSHRRKLEMSLIQENFTLQRCYADREQIEKWREAFQQEKEKLNEEVADLIDGREKLEKQVSQLQRDNLKNNDKLEKIEEEALSLSNSLQMLRGHVQKEEGLFRKSQGEWHRCKHEIELLRTKDLELEKQEIKLQEEGLSLKTKKHENQSADWFWKKSFRSTRQMSKHKKKNSKRKKQSLLP